MSSKTTNLNLTKPSEDEFYDINVQNENMDIIDREIGGLKQPAYEVPTAMSDLHSGEMITVAFGKIAKAVSTLISHTTSKATNSVLGHVKLSDSTSSTSASTAGVAATPKAVKAAYDLANSNTEKIGTTDISGIGDGTVTGAIVNNKEAIEDVSQSLTSKIVGIEINKNIVTDNYSYAYLKSGIGILNIDIIVESFPLSTEVDILYTGFRPTMNLYINTVNSNGNNITIHINTNGIVQVYSKNPGKFGIRTQFIIV